MPALFESVPLPHRVPTAVVDAECGETIPMATQRVDGGHGGGLVRGISAMFIQSAGEGARMKASGGMTPMRFFHLAGV